MHDTNQNVYCRVASITQYLTTTVSNGSVSATSERSFPSSFRFLMMPLTWPKRISFTPVSQWLSNDFHHYAVLAHIPRSWVDAYAENLNFFVLVLSAGGRHSLSCAPAYRVTLTSATANRVIQSRCKCPA